MRISDWSSDVCSADLLWKVARETASRVRSRMEIVINSTKAKALADNSNPARQALWNNHHNPAQLAILRYAGLNGKQVKSHFKAMDWVDVPLFAKQLLRKSDYSAKALALTILCATRSNETINATWRSEERRVGTEGVSKCRSLWWPY